MSNNSPYSHNSEWLSSIKDFAEVVDKNLGSELDPSPNRKGSSVNEKVRGRFSFENRVDQSLKRLNGFDTLFAMTEAMVTYTMQIARMSGADEWETEELKAKLADAARRSLADPEKAPLPFIIPEMYEILHQKTVVEPVFNEVIALHQKMQESDRKAAEDRAKHLTECLERLERERAEDAELAKSEAEHLKECDEEATDLLAKISARMMEIAMENVNKGKTADASDRVAAADPEIQGLQTLLGLVEAKRADGPVLDEAAQAARRRSEELSALVARTQSELTRVKASLAAADDASK